jgi:hypothetical protein
MRFIVKTNYPKRDIIKKYSLTVVKEYNELQDFFVAELDLDQVEVLRNDPKIQYVIIDRKKEFRLQEFDENSTVKDLLPTETFSSTQTTVNQWHLNYLMK